MKKRIFLMLLSIFLIALTSLIGQEPVSKQGTIVESISSAEIMVEATGIYHGQGKKDKHKVKDIQENGVREALIDARMSALYTILFGGTDPVLRENEERGKFNEVKSNFYSLDALSRYISYEDAQLLKKIKMNGGTSIKVTKRFKINKEILYQDLVSANILIAREDLSQSIGNPMIMVIPAAKQNENPIDLLKNNPAVKHASAVIQSYLTARKYDVIVPEQQQTLENLASAQNMVEGRESDYAYELALSIGSDVYITFSGTFEDAGFGTQKYAINIKAFETTTARLLGAETGYSQGRKGETMVSIEEAMNDAVDKVLARITSYWKDDLSRGIQYKVLVSLSTEFDEDQVEDIQFAFMDAVEEIAKNSKENILTKQTIDYLLWCDAEKYDKSSKVYRSIKKAFNNAGTDGTLRRVNINRKMIMLKMDYE
ncbi:hypothetical protein KAJ27_17985 [bacterium]|nr:hypothetical protein [Bacteroidales bacterium]MCK5686028.1 hypothetical protein [bacterium]